MIDEGDKAWYDEKILSVLQDKFKETWTVEQIEAVCVLPFNPKPCLKP